MALNGLYCADVPLSNYSLTHSMFRYSKQQAWLVPRCGLWIVEAVGLQRTGYRAYYCSTTALQRGQSSNE